MPNILAILDLESEAPHIQFPPPSKEFCLFKLKLRELIRMECGSSLSNTLEYDDNTQMFYVKVWANAHPLVPFTLGRLDDGFNCVLSKYFYIDPKRPLEAQLEAINDLYKQLADRVAQLTRLLQEEQDTAADAKGNHGDS